MRRQDRWQDGPPAPVAPAPAQAPVGNAPSASLDHGVTLAHGRYYRNEGLEPSGKNPFTAEDVKLMAQRSREAAEYRKLLDDLNFAAALQLGNALSQD